MLFFGGYEQHSLSHLEIINSLVYNPTRVRMLITHFLAQHKKHNAYVSFCLSGPHIAQYYVTLPTAHPKSTDFGIAQSNAFEWGYRFMYHNDEGLAVFYVYKIPRALLLQYQLIAIAAHLNLIAITTDHMALYATYKTLFGKTFRQTQYALDMMKHKNCPDKLITLDALKRIITLPAHHNALTALPSFATTYGLYALQGDIV